MIHGGLRYLQKDPDVTLHSCGRFGARSSASRPTLIFRIPFVDAGVSRGSDRGPSWSRSASRCTTSISPSRTGARHTRLSRAEALRLEPRLTRLECAFTLDEWGVDAARLTAANALDAAERGAVVLTHTELVEWLREPGGGRVVGGACATASTAKSS